MYTQSDQLLGINQQTLVGTVFVPGFLELATCFLRLALTTEPPLKTTYRVSNGPPATVINWTDRAAACALTLCQHGILLTVCVCGEARPSGSRRPWELGGLGSPTTFCNSFCDLAVAAAVISTFAVAGVATVTVTIAVTVNLTVTVTAASASCVT